MKQPQSLSGTLCGRNPSTARPACCRSPALLQLPTQQLHHLPDGSLIPPIPSPLPMLRSLDQPRPGQNPHMMRDCGLGELNALLDIAPAQTGSVNMLRSCRFTGRSFFQDQQNAAAGGICNRVQSPIECSFRGHADHRYRGNRWMSIYYFLTIGLYPSPTSFVRIPSASLKSAKGPSCTRNSLSVVAWGATKAG